MNPISDDQKAPDHSRASAFSNALAGRSCLRLQYPQVAQRGGVAT